MDRPHKIIIIGGGAAGFFAAINAAENAAAKNRNVEIYILEFSSQVLKKVRISGGGRCNVTHHLFEPRLFCERYPRGYKELRASFEKFQARDTVEWFKQRGVQLVAEEDGRMFPTTNSSETIIGCFLNLAQSLGVKVLMNQRVTAVVPLSENQFRIDIEGKESIIGNSVLIATGSSPQGYQLARDVGHTITDLAPSLFSFIIEDTMLEDLSGLSFPAAEVKLIIPGAKNFKEKGPLLITHWGLSGPVILKISAWAAREMKVAQYRAKIIVNWLGSSKQEEVYALIQKLKDNNLKSQVQNVYPDVLAKRFWLKVLERSQVHPDKRYADLSKTDMNKITQVLFSQEFSVNGKNRYKDEFVECGGVSLKEIHFKTMESKIRPGLFFSGEVLDIDGITGGFNFQNAWTGSWIAAQYL